MGTKIDFIAAFKPLQKILRNEKLDDSEKVEMVLEVIEDVLEEAKS